MRPFHTGLCVALGAGLINGAALAEEVIVPLDDFLGVYDAYSSVTLPIDAGVSFSRITDAHIEWQGTGTGGYAYFGGVECDWWAAFPTRFRADLAESGDSKADAHSALVGEDTYPDPEPFDTVSNMGLDPGETWEFLLDGQCDLRVDMYWSFVSFCNVSIYNYPSGTLDAAQLVIVGMRPGDFDGDGDVDEDDHGSFGLCFTGPDGGPVSPACQPGDFDEDDDIDCADRSEFELAWTEPDGPPEFEPCRNEVPSMSAWGLTVTVFLTTAAATIVLRRRPLAA